VSGDAAGTAWTAALRAYAERLDHAAAAVVEGRPDDVPAFQPPVGLPPLPASHRRHAEDLLQQSIALEHLMQQRMASIASTPRGGHERTSSFFDARA
jgi:hypothetical protein